MINNFNFCRETVDPVLHTGGCKEVELVQLKKKKIVVEKNNFDIITYTKKE